MTHTPANQSFNIPQIIKSAWASTTDTKGAIWIPAIIAIIASMLISYAVASLFQINLAPEATRQAASQRSLFLAQLINTFVITIVVAPFITGMLMVAIKRARDEAIENNTGLKYISSWIKLAAINFIITVFALLIDLFFSLILALVIPASQRYTQAGNSHALLGGGVILLITVIMFICYLLFYAFLVFSMPVAVDRNLKPWEAIGTSCGLVAPQWLRMLGIEVIVSIILLIALLPISLSVSKHSWTMIIGGVISLVLIIWALPYVILIHGEAYKALTTTAPPDA